MKTAVLFLFAFLSVALAAATETACPGPVVLDCPAGTACRTWMKDGVTYLHVANTTSKAVSGTVTLNEIYEKVINLTNRLPAEIDGRWIAVELTPGGEMTLRLGK